MLSDVAKKTKSAALLELSNKARRDSFAKVTEMIDTMVADLKKEQEDEFKHQEFCAKELQQNLASQASTEDTISDLTATIATLEADIDTLAKEIKELEAQVVEMKVQVKLRTPVNSIEYFPPNFEGLVLGCIDADFCK